MKVYTKTGDAGTTSLIGGARVAKDDPRVEAYGTIDELQAAVACLRDLLVERSASKDYIADLEHIIADLMIAGGRLALDADAPEAIRRKLPALPCDAVTRLEKRIDAMSRDLPELRAFTLPGGHPACSLAHLCRTLCRRAERRIVAVSHAYPIDDRALAYVNRLSDYLYTLARALALFFNVSERLFLE